ncbi:DNA methyltransferase [Eubacterium callanderi]|uniref:DNA methyltransferase n=1 Tax=Eubacterium callanderi TaxID=53442 RepID=UPI001C11CBA5|nr:DNA methyltransferase [Eubacterium callanderi]MBU5306004.1 methylase [Eubacterium callanderi]
MTDNLQRIAAKKFADTWKGKGYEKGESQKFWLALLRNVYGIEEPENFIVFEDQVHLDHTSFIDGIIPSTHVLIEQKGLGKDLRKPIKQSDGTLLKPIQQAKRYAAELPYSQRPRWIVTCNFSTFLVYDMENPANEPEEILLENLPTEYYRLAFLVDTGNEHLKREMEISIQAGEIVGLLYDEILKQYLNPANEESLKSLNMLCVRLVFCLYAEDADIFGKHSKFYDYLSRFEARDLRLALIDLFKVLDTKPENRDPYMDPLLASFPYVNGGLFSDENIEIPQFNEKIKELLLEKASDDFNWSEISPTIFGAVFESTLNPETRRSGGMHYTSIENIHKVIDPLFLDDLRKELEDIKSVSVDKTREKKLKEYQAKLGSLQFLDPACGSGNFLTETYLSLRRLENKVLEAITYGQIGFTDQAYSPIQVSISQFYGIEINDFAVTVAKTALWIAESQMMKETENVIHISLDFLPLKSYANIIEANALQLDWESVVPKENVNYIMGNPPFIGYSLQTPAQKQEIRSIYIDEEGKPYKTAGKIDYVAGWYFKAAQFMDKVKIRTAFVSTNSITQGEQVAGVWKPLYDRFGIHIDFAYRTFKWSSEAKEKAAVHCVIVGFSQAFNSKNQVIYIDGMVKHVVENISPYLIDAPLVFIESRKKALCHVPSMTTGNRPADGGNLIIEADEYDDFLRREPSAKKYIKQLTGATEYINNKLRYCLWLVGATPSEIRKMPEVIRRVEACRQDRLKGAPDRQKLANTPTLFREVKNPENYIIIPRVSSENRRYIPLGFLDSKIIPTDSATIIEDALIYHFGLLTSNVHMAWMRAVAGRLKSDYRYSKDIVYNNFPWPTPTEVQKSKIEQTAQAILDARALYPDCSLADLYDEATMPAELRKAHQLNDRAVMQAYGLSVKDTSEAQCVAELMRLYQKLVSNLDS